MTNTKANNSLMISYVSQRESQHRILISSIATCYTLLPAADKTESSQSLIFSCKVDK